MYTTCAQTLAKRDERFTARSKSASPLRKLAMASSIVFLLRMRGRSGSGSILLAGDPSLLSPAG